MIQRLRLIGGALVLLIATFGSAPASAEGVKIAMMGYDPVAYFTLARATKGSAEFSHVWDGERYLFASAEHRDRFAAAPERYAPQFPGHCAAALTRGEIVTPHPENWVIIRGKLYIFGKPIGRKMFRDNPELAKLSEENWKRVRKAAD